MPTLTVIAGPNGSGKSTIMRSLRFEGRERLLDPDAVARALNPGNPAAAAVAAGRRVLELTAEYLQNGWSFAIETTLSGRGNVELMREAKSRGFQVELACVALDEPERNLLRIRNRVANGGHFVPDADVKRRYARSMTNAAEALRLADFAMVFDNSGDRPRLVAVARAARIGWCADPLPAWLAAIPLPW